MDCQLRPGIEQHDRTRRASSALDARSLQAAKKVADGLKRHFGGLDITFLNAGIGRKAADGVR